MRYENPSDARLLREAYARTTRRPHTETFAEKVVRDALFSIQNRIPPEHIVHSKYLNIQLVYSSDDKDIKVHVASVH